MKKLKNSMAIVIVMLIGLVLGNAQTEYTLQFYQEISTNRFAEPGQKIGPMRISIDASIETNDVEILSFPVVINYLTGEADSVSSVEIAYGNNIVGTVTNLPTKFELLSFTEPLSLGSFGEEPYNLQRFLNGSEDTQVADGTNFGAPNLETYYFGSRTRAALTIFQEKNSLTNGVLGELDTATIEFINALRIEKRYLLVSVPFPTPVAVPAGTQSEFQVYLHTSTNAWGQLAYQILDPTDGYNDVIVAGTTNWVLENFNPQPGWTNSFVIQTKLGIVIGNDGSAIVTTYATPGSSHTLEYTTSLDTRNYLELSTFQVTDGAHTIAVTKTPLGELPRTNLFFRAKQISPP